MDNQQQQPSGRTQPVDGAPAHLSVEADRPIETQSGEAAAKRAALAIADFVDLIEIARDKLQYVQSLNQLLNTELGGLETLLAEVNRALAEAKAEGGLNSELSDSASEGARRSREP